MDRTAPSTFSSINDTLANYTAFLCLARLQFALVSLIEARYHRSLTSISFIRSCLCIPSLLIWVSCFFQSSTVQFYLLFGVGVAVDIMSSLGGDIYHLTHLNKEGVKVRTMNVMFRAMKSNAKIFFGFCVVFFYESRRFAEYSDSNTAVQFNMVNYIWGSLASMVLFALFSMYSESSCHWIVSERVMNPRIQFGYFIFVKWAHYIMLGSFCAICACLSILVFDLYNPVLLTTQFPIQLSTFPDVILANTAFGIDYFVMAAALAGVTPPQWSAYHLPLLFGSLGIYLMTFSFIEFTSLQLANRQSKKRCMLIFAVGLAVMIISWIPISWNTSNQLLILCLVSGIITLILVLSQFFNMLGNEHAIPSI